MADPIWKDHFTNLGSYSSRYFRIQQPAGTTIYTGRAFRAASSGNLYVRINDICADRMALPVPALNPTSAPGGQFPMSFKVQSSSDGSTWSDVETVSFNDDWSYDTSFDPSTLGMSFPITGRVDLRQKIFQTRYNNTSISATAYYGATTKSVSLNVSINTDFTAMRNGLAAAGAGYVEFSCPNNATYSGKTLTAVEIGLTTYTVTAKCPRYCVYYKNPFGGYDHLLIEGTAKHRKTVEKNTFVADYNNTKQNRETWDFSNELTDSWTLSTGILTDEESERMPYLLDSPDVYLCDLVNASVFLPAVIDTSTYDVRTFLSNGRKMFDCSFDLSIAQKQYRR